MIKHFLISPIFFFLMKEDFWYVVLILDFTDLDVYISFIYIQNFSPI